MTECRIDNVSADTNLCTLDDKEIVAEINIGEGYGFLTYDGLMGLIKELDNIKRVFAERTGESK